MYRVLTRYGVIEADTAEEALALGRALSEKGVRIGRPATELPGGLTVDEHEELRMRLKLSKRAYAARLGVHHNTYIHKTKP